MGRHCMPKYPSTSIHNEKSELPQSDLTEDEIIYLRRAWRLLGGNELGTLAVRKLGTILRGFGKNPTEQEVDYLKYEHGLNDHHRVTYDEALKLFLKCKNHVDKDEMMIDAFQKFDEEQRGFILASELRDIMVRLGEPLTKDELDEMIKDADINRNGKINYKEFSKMITVSPFVMMTQSG